MLKKVLGITMSIFFISAAHASAMTCGQEAHENAHGTGSFAMQEHMDDVMGGNAYNSMHNSYQWPMNNNNNHENMSSQKEDHTANHSGHLKDHETNDLDGAKPEDFFNF